MLFLHPDTRARLQAAREHMRELDRFGFREHSIEPHFKSDFEEQLRYLNEYGCGSDSADNYNLFSMGVFMTHEPSFGFALVWKKPGDGTLHLPVLGTATQALEQAQWHILNDFYRRQTMTGGLVFHGPTDLTKATKEQLERKDSWMVHT